MDTSRPSDFVLDHPGSADATTMLRLGGFVLVTLIAVVITLAYGRTPLTAYPAFISFYSGFLLLANGATAILLFGQFGYRRLPLYVILGAAYSFSAISVFPYVLTYPGALIAECGVFGGEQSHIWIWLIGHTVFPLMLLWALLKRTKRSGRVSHALIAMQVTTAVVAALCVVVLIAVLVTHYSHLFPVLPLAKTPSVREHYHMAAGVAALATLLAIVAAIWRAWKRSVLHVWLLAVLLTLLTEIAFEMGGYSRYSLGWYFGKIESMVAAVILLPVFFSQVSRLYVRLMSIAEELATENAQLDHLLREKGSMETALRASRAQVRTLAFHDTVTGLPNRLLLGERLRHALEHGTRYRHATAVLFMDLDGFEEIIERHGAAVGDMLLKAIAKRLAPCIRGEDTFARISNDAFVIVVPELTQHQDAAAVAGKVLELLGDAFEIKGHRVRITASIGIGIREARDMLEAGVLLHRAEIAMHNAKRAGGNRFNFNTAE